MIIIYNQKDKQRLSRRSHPNYPDSAALPKEMIMNANMVIEIGEGSFQYIKNRYTGDNSIHPIEELPEDLKQIVVVDLKWRDDIDTREDNEI